MVTEARVTIEDVYRVLSLVSDPEMPGISLVDLGMVDRVSVSPDGVLVVLTPTFVGCPALQMMQDDAFKRLSSAFATRTPMVRVVFETGTAWTSDRILPTCHASLRSRGIAPPVSPEQAVMCPWCGSSDTVREGLFGPAACRSIHYCRTCRNPFEALKSI